MYQPTNAKTHPVGVNCGRTGTLSCSDVIITNGAREGAKMVRIRTITESSFLPSRVHVVGVRILTLPPASYPLLGVGRTPNRRQESETDWMAGEIPFES